MRGNYYRWMGCVVGATMGTVGVSGWVGGWRGRSLCEDGSGGKGGVTAGGGERWRVTQPAKEAYKYVVCGGGTAAQEAIRTLLEGDPSGSLLVVTEEIRLPYNQSPLYRWYRGKAPLNPTGLDVFSGHKHFDADKHDIVYDRVVGVDVQKNMIHLGSGATAQYEQCLLAMGGKQPPTPWDGSHSVLDGRRHDDQAELIRRLGGDTRQHITIVGGGWIPCYIASVISSSNLANVTMVYPEPAPLSRYLPKYMTDYIIRHFKAHKVELLPYTMLRWIQSRGDEAEVHACRTFDSQEVVGILTDAVVLSPTFIPSLVDYPDNIRLDDLIRVNESIGGIDCNPELLAASNLYVAGDLLACGQNRNQSQDGALASGHHAAVNMLGDRRGYQNGRIYSADIPIANASVICVGDVDATYDTYGFFTSTKRQINDMSRSGIVFYTQPKSTQVAGIVLWNCNPQMVKHAEKLVGGQANQRLSMERELKPIADTFIQEKDSTLPVVAYVRNGRRLNKGSCAAEGEQLWDTAPRASGNPNTSTNGSFRFQDQLPSNYRSSKEKRRDRDNKASGT